MHRLAIDPASLDEAVVARVAVEITRGALVALGTDTLYGLAVDPTSGPAVQRLFDAKSRSAREALPVVAADRQQVIEWFGALPAWADRLGSDFWPGPLSVLLPAPPTFVTAVHAGTGLVAVRVPDHTIARALARAAGTPLTATSANPSGRAPATTADEVEASLGSLVDILIDTGPSPGGPPSTIVAMTDERIRLVREGAVPWERVLRSLHAR
jgi:L-threonylcarbamoyladenylate synthase